MLETSPLLASTGMLNLDTHILIYALIGDLTKKEHKLLSSQQWSISSIALWEIAKLSQLGRINLDINEPEFAVVISNLHVWPIDLAVARKLNELDFNSDPADEIIAATSIVRKIPLVTRDKTIRKSKMIPFA